MGSSAGFHGRLFVYGTLMDDGVICALTGRRFPKKPAVLSGYRKVVPDGGYPYIVPDADAVTDGFVILGLDDEALRILDRYEDEGCLYRRIEVVATVDDRPLPCMAYGAVAGAPSVS